MPIPRINKQTQFKAPKVAEGRAVDASKQVAQAYEPALNSIKLINEAGNSALKFAVAQNRADAQYKAQNALNEYIEGINALDLEFQHYTYEEAQKQLPKYYERAQGLHNKFINSIDNVDVTDIREQYRQQVNKFNLDKKQETELYVYKQKKEAEKRTFEETQKMESDRASRAVNPYASGEDNMVSFTSALQNGISGSDLFGANNWEPEAVIKARNEQWVGQTFEKAVFNMANATDFGLSDDPYKNVREFITAMRGKVPEDVWQKVAEDYEKQSLNLAFAKNPDEFRVTSNPSQFNDTKAKYFAPHLNTWARWKHLKDVSDGTNRNGNIQDGILASELNKKLTNAIKQNLIEADKFAQNTYFLDKTSKGFEIGKTNKVSPKKVFNTIKLIEAIQNGHFWYNGKVEPEKQWEIDSGQDAQQMENKGYTWLSVQPTDKETAQAYQDTYNALVDEYKRMWFSGEASKATRTTRIDSMVNPSLIDDLRDMLYIKDYENKPGWFKSKWNEFTNQQPEVGYNSEMLYRATRAVEDSVAKQIAVINEIRKSNGYKQDIKQEVFTKFGDAECVKYLDDLTQTEPIYDIKGNKLDYIQLIEEGVASGLALELPKATLNKIRSSISYQSPSQNYYDLNNSNVQTRQSTILRDFIKEREKYKQEQLSKSYGVGTGGFAISNYDYEQIQKAKAKREALKKSLSEKQKTLAFEEISNKIIED